MSERPFSIALVCRRNLIYLSELIYSSPMKILLPAGNTYEMALRVIIPDVRLAQLHCAETTRLLGEAFDAARAALHDRGQPEIVYEIVAKRIIEAAKKGERDPIRCGIDPDSSCELSYFIQARRCEMLSVVDLLWGMRLMAKQTKISKIAKKTAKKAAKKAAKKSNIKVDRSDIPPNSSFSS